MAQPCANAGHVLPKHPATMSLSGSAEIAIFALSHRLCSRLRSGRKVLLGAAGAMGLAVAARLGQGAPVISFGVLSMLLGSALCIWLSEKFAGWQSKFTYSDYDHTAKG